MPTKYLFLMALTPLALITSSEDIRFGKIRNIWILAGIGYALILYGATTFQENYHFGMIFLNFILSVLTGYILWKFDFWSPGDAKLFSVFSLLLPLQTYHKIYISFFPAFNLLLNIFIPGAMYLFVMALFHLFCSFHLKISFYKITRTANKNYSKILKNIATFTSIFMLNQYTNKYVTTFFATFIQKKENLFLIMFLAYRPISRIFLKNKILLHSLMILMLGLCLFDSYYTSPLAVFFKLKNAILMSTGLIVLYEGFKKLTDSYIDGSKTKTIPFAIWICLGVLITFFYKELETSFVAFSKIWSITR